MSPTAIKWREMRGQWIGWKDSIKLGSARGVCGVDAVDRHGDDEHGNWYGKLDENVDEDQDQGESEDG